MDGFEVLKQVRGTPTFIELPVIMLTSSDLEADRIRAEMLGLASFVTKPDDPADLRALIGHALAPYCTMLEA